MVSEILTDINKDRLRCMLAAHKELRKLESADRSRFHEILKQLVSNLNRRDPKASQIPLAAGAEEHVIPEGKSKPSGKNKKQEKSK